MPRQPHDLTDLHLTILAALWRLDEGTIADIHAAMGRKARIARKTLGTLLARLEERGWVERRMEGREGVYRATVTRRKVLLTRLQQTLAAIFDEGETALGSAAVRRRDAAKGDAEQLRRLLRRAERDLS